MTPRPHHRKDLLSWAPWLTLLVLLGPILMGLLGTLAPAFGWLPALGHREFDLTPWRDLFAEAGIARSIQLSVTTGLSATLISLLLAVLICAAWQGTGLFSRIERLLPPLLSVPHAAAAFGLAFLIAPSGWIVRWFSPWATGWDIPPDVLIVQDPWGLAMIAGLVVKEVPFLLLMLLAALGQVDATRSRLVAQTLGYGRIMAWIKGVLPQIYPQIRLPVYAVLAYSMSVVDVAMILGPSTPAPLAVKVITWMNDPDLSLRLRAAAAAVLQFLLVLAALGIWKLGEFGLARLGRHWLETGGRGQRQALWSGLGLGAITLIVASLVLGLLGLALWSVAGLWVFPDALPQHVTLQSWSRYGPALGRPLVDTLIIAVTVVLLALVLTVACLETEYRHGSRPTTRSLWLLYLPLLVPQVGFLPGLQVLFVGIGVNGTLGAVILAHLIFVLPYVFLALADPYRAWDPRTGTVAASLGASANRILWRVRLPMLLTPLLVAAAVGFATSVGQYLPTLLTGGGRITTLTTEAVALASGGDRRIIGIYALLQMALPFIAFSLAIAIPACLYHRRLGMRNTL
ncbi:MAG: ABC transporter permease subunit [Pseudomonadales bacterium]|nr:ABC transporter permease subunit [Pseudomonadales bacterium]